MPSIKLKYCPYCQEKHAIEGSKFCTNCGERQPVVPEPTPSEVASTTTSTTTSTNSAGQYREPSSVRPLSSTPASSASSASSSTQPTRSYSGFNTLIQRAEPVRQSSFTPHTRQIVNAGARAVSRAPQASTDGRSTTAPAAHARATAAKKAAPIKKEIHINICAYVTYVTIVTQGTVDHWKYDDRILVHEWFDCELEEEYNAMIPWCKEDRPNWLLEHLLSVCDFESVKQPAQSYPGYLDHFCCKGFSVDTAQPIKPPAQSLVTLGIDSMLMPYHHTGSKSKAAYDVSIVILVDTAKPKTPKTPKTKKGKAASHTASATTSDAESFKIPSPLPPRRLRETPASGPTSDTASGTARRSHKRDASSELPNMPDRSRSTTRGSPVLPSIEQSIKKEPEPEPEPEPSTKQELAPLILGSKSQEVINLCSSDNESMPGADTVVQDLLARRQPTVAPSAQQALPTDEPTHQPRGGVRPKRPRRPVQVPPSDRETRSRRDRPLVEDSQ